MASTAGATRKSRRKLVAFAIAAAIAIPMVIAPNAVAAKSRFGVVVVHGDDSVDTECVKLGADVIRAFDLLQQTSFDFFTESFGDLGRAVCYLDDEGHVPPTGCFGPNFDSPSWGLWYQKPREGAVPRFSTNAGLSFLKVRNKGIIYLVFREFEPPSFTQAAPTQLTIQSIC